MGQNDDERILIARALDKARQAELTADSVTGDFYDPAERALLTAVFARRKGTARLHAFGGYPQAERMRAVFTPDDEEPSVEDYRLQVLELRQRDPNSQLLHPAVMGAVLAQGIKREKIGDIIVGEGLAWIIVDQSLADTVTLTSVGRDAVTCSMSSLTTIAEYAPQVDCQTVTVASPRLDAVLAAVFHLSRSDAVGAIKRGLVKVNHQPETAASRNLKEGDLLSLRGKGRARLVRLAGETRKGRLRLEVERPKR